MKNKGKIIEECQGQFIEEWQGHVTLVCQHHVRGICIRLINIWAVFAKQIEPKHSFF